MALAYGQGRSISVMMAGPFNSGGGVAAKLARISLPVANWKGGESPYYQNVTVDGISVNSVINMQPTVEQIEMLHSTALTAVNDAGSVTVYAIGDKPTADMTFQATLMEVISE